MPVQEHHENEHDEYELVPLNPIRKMEKRIERVEKFGTSQDLMKQLLDIVRTNQQVVDDIVRINSDMISRVSILSDSVSNLTGKMQDFMEKIDTIKNVSGSSSQDIAKTREFEQKIEERLEKMEKRLNAMILTSMPRMQQQQRRPAPQQAQQYGPVPA